ncbi:MAG: aldehyde dehydrogenase family protein [Gammaproteobacteria bacterium]|nr:aldehyde dehydrogenase family protein [Gammaproteobacteria bacterium]
MNNDFPMMVPGLDDNGRLNVTSPWDQKVIGSVPTINAEGAERALEIAHSIYADRSRWLPVPQRLEILKRTAAIMEIMTEQLTQEAAREGGKPLIDSKVEVLRAIDGVYNAMDCLKADAGREIPMNLNAASSHRLAMTQKEPIGVVLAISAFNHPLNLIVHQVIPAIASGCPVIVKPAEDTPLSCFRLVTILREAGLPEEYCMAVMTESMEVAEQLVTDARLGFFSFIGSAKVGWMLRSKLAPGTRCALEHGGAAPVIIAEDADLDEMLPLIAKGGFYHAGQVCVSVQRVFAHRSIADTVAARLAEFASSLNCGDPNDETTEVGPLIRPREVERVSTWVNEAVEEGATLVTGGDKLGDACYACTVLYEPSAESKVSQLEIFGPVICVYAYDDIEDAVTRANDIAFSFQAAIATSNLDTALYCYKNLNASAVMVNDHTAFRVDWMPFAGLKQSGLGIGGIPYTFEDMQVEKMMVIRSSIL